MRSLIQSVLWQEFYKHIGSTNFQPPIITASNASRYYVACHFVFLVMSRHPSRSLVSTVATGSDNQQGFCLGLKVCLLALPCATRHLLSFSSSTLSTTTTLPGYFPGPISALFRLVYVFTCALTKPSAFNTTSFSLTSS